MTKRKTEIETRKHEHELEIDASPEEVWKAITQAEELIRWFPLQAEVEPGKGGSMHYGWGDFSGTCEILEWQPPRHLKTSWMQAPSTEAEASPIVVDWYLEGRGGKTRLRLVHSGFGPGEEWNEEFEGTRRGWNFELFGLKQYLERHRGEVRRAFWLRQDVSGAGEVWDSFLEALLPGQDFSQLQEGQFLELDFGSGVRVRGRVVLWAPPHELSLTAEDWNQGLLRIGIDNCGFGQQAHIWVSLWGPSAGSQASLLEGRLENALKRALIFRKSFDILYSFPIQASREEIYAAVSSPHGLDRWWSLESSGEPAVGAPYELDFGPGYLWGAIVTRAVPNREFEIRMTSADADWTGTRVGFRLESAQSGATQVDFRHVGWPEANSHYRVSGFCWAMYLRLLKRYLEKGEEVAYEDRLEA